MKIAEVFHSLQGEGILTGMPSGFIRFAGCNLRCAWCDTKYASWYPETEPWTKETVLAEIAKYNTRYVVITGGEPTIHPQLLELTQELRALGKHITVETNGTTFREGVACDLISMSPKLKHSIADAAEFPELVRLIDRDIPVDRIMLMPEGVDAQKILQRSPVVVAACKQYGYRYCARLHIDLFGNTKGT